MTFNYADALKKKPIAPERPPQQIKPVLNVKNKKSDHSVPTSGKKQEQKQQQQRPQNSTRGGKNDNIKGPKTTTKAEPGAPNSKNLQTKKSNGTKSTKDQTPVSNGNKKNTKQKNNNQPKSKKPKPSKGMQLGDVLKIVPKSSKQQQTQKVEIKSKQAIPSSQDFPSLGSPVPAPAKLPALSTWAKPSAAPPQKTEKKKPTPILSSQSKSKKVQPTTSISSKPKKESKAKNKSNNKKELSVEQQMASLLSVFGAKQRSAEEESALGTFLKDTSQIQKGRQRLQPRKKKFSVLKKKVLQERLAKWKALHPDPVVGDRTVAIWDYAHPDEMEDPDEYQELVDNIRDMASKVGETTQVFLDETNGAAFCHFASPSLAASANACWNGLLVGGEKLTTEVIEIDGDWIIGVKNYKRDEDGSSVDVSMVVLENILTEDDLEDPDCLEESLSDIKQMAIKVGNLVDISVQDGGAVILKYQGPQTAVSYFDKTVFGGQVVTAKSQAAPPSTSSIVMSDVLTEDDFEDADCMEESMDYLKGLAALHGKVIDVRIDDKSVIVLYKGPDTATVAAKKINGKVLGGQTLAVSVLKETTKKVEEQEYELVLSNVLTEDDLEDQDCLDETKADITDLAGQVLRPTRIDVDTNASLVTLCLKCSEDKARDLLGHFNGMVVGGQTISAVLHGQDKAPIVNSTEQEQSPAKGTPAEDAAKADKENKKDDTGPMYSGDKLIAERFAECKRAPKIPNGQNPRTYATGQPQVVNDPNIKPLLSELLGELMRLQRRAMEENNTKAKRRLVMGLREVARGIRSHKVKLVVMANNLDEYGAIDAKLQEIIDLAKQEAVPVFFEFSKRSLGKAIGKNIKIGVVGVQNAEGAHQQFKKLVNLANRHGIV